MLPVSFGAMLMESMLAIIALIAVAFFAKGEAAAQGLTNSDRSSQEQLQTSWKSSVCHILWYLP